MPPNVSARVWAALCGKYPELVEHGTIEPEMIIAGSLDAFQRVKPDKVNGIPPELHQVEAYFTELKSACSAQQFIDYYDMVGWVVGGAKHRMKDWRAAARLWARREAAQGPVPKKPQGTASLFALQAQLKTVETELETRLYPSGSAFKVMPTPGSPAWDRMNKLSAQRTGLKAQIDQFAIG